jgi:hypothetical protein
MGYGIWDSGFGIFEVFNFSPAGNLLIFFTPLSDFTLLVRLYIESDKKA